MKMKETLDLYLWPVTCDLYIHTSRRREEKTKRLSLLEEEGREGMERKKEGEKEMERKRGGRREGDGKGRDEWMERDELDIREEKGGEIELEMDGWMTLVWYGMVCY